MDRVIPRRVTAGLLALFVTCAGARCASAALHVAVHPSVQTVIPGTDFDVTLDVTTGGAAFSGFHAIVAYDPAVLTPVTLSPLRYQLGSLVTNTCSSLFHVFKAGNGRDSIDVAMLCAGKDVSGPGTIYKLRFHASAVPQVTTIAFLPTPEFADSGIYLPDITWSDAAVGIGVTPTLDATAPRPVPALLASPNPARGPVAFALGVAASAGARLSVLDVQGRSVRRLDVPAGARSATWDGRDAAGARVPPGVYHVVIDGAGTRASTTVLEVR